MRRRNSIFHLKREPLIGRGGLCHNNLDSLWNGRGPVRHQYTGSVTGSGFGVGGWGWGGEKKKVSKT